MDLSGGIVFFDPLYLLVMGIGLVLSFGAQAWVKSATSRWDRVPLRGGMTGKDIAAAILRARGVRGVRIEMVGGVLSDHYDPRSRTLRLSQGVYNGRSVTAAGIAAHEVGHAIQDADKYALMSLRQNLVPIARIGTSIGVYMVMLGAFISVTVAKLGVLVFGGFVLFTVVTLPVEIDASMRARRLLLTTLSRRRSKSQRGVDGCSCDLFGCGFTSHIAVVVLCNESIAFGWTRRLMCYVQKVHVE